MNYLVVKRNPLPDISLLEIFEGQHSEGSILYPVTINGLYMMFEKTESSGWVTKGMAFSFPPEVIQYVIELIEEHQPK